MFSIRGAFSTCILLRLLLLLLMSSALPDIMSADAFQASSAVTAAVRTLPLQQVVLSRTVPSRHHSIQTPTATRMMVRNIDLPEALILYGRDVLYVDNNSVRPGLSELVQECCDVETAVIVLLQDTSIDGDDPLDKHKDADNRIVSSLLASNKKYNKNRDAHCITVVRAPEPMAMTTRTDTTTTLTNPQPLLDAISSVHVQERAFGGSAGFGQKPVDPSWRPPLAARCVVLTWTLAQTRAARACGMRVLQVNHAVDDPLADYALLPGQLALEFGVDDIATPGSFWLNPPHPRDEFGNQVDPYELMERYHEHTVTVSANSAAADLTDTTQSAVAVAEEATADDDYLDSILADLAPL